ncbi:unnamed protein product [Heligmosomoides polygyrus]|uniref:Serine/arginine repetitive matrix protein 2-like n=1 Tax=Heligmosomoides polygyrus TaxID=6339 RepID=A0A183G8P2_HELPZ|nr:unnamed protein product [Heligmosomoides polygyrus]
MGATGGAVVRGAASTLEEATETIAETATHPVNYIVSSIQEWVYKPKRKTTSTTAQQYQRFKLNEVYYKPKNIKKMAIIDGLLLATKNRRFANYTALSGRETIYKPEKKVISVYWRYPLEGWIRGYNTSKTTNPSNRKHKCDRTARGRRACFKVIRRRTTRTSKVFEKTTHVIKKDGKGAATTENRTYTKADRKRVSERTTRRPKPSTKKATPTVKRQMYERTARGHKDNKQWKHMPKRTTRTPKASKVTPAVKKHEGKRVAREHRTYVKKAWKHIEGTTRIPKASKTTLTVRKHEGERAARRRRLHAKKVWKHTEETTRAPTTTKKLSGNIKVNERQDYTECTSKRPGNTPNKRQNDPNPPRRPFRLSRSRVVDEREEAIDHTSGLLGNAQEEVIS